jgi:hypothetical protein
MSKRDEDLKDSFYLYIMRNSIGAGLKSHYSTNGRMPDRITELLQELDEAEDHRAQDQPAGENHPEPVVPGRGRKQ